MNSSLRCQEKLVGTSVLMKYDLLMVEGIQSESVWFPAFVNNYFYWHTIPFSLHKIEALFLLKNNESSFFAKIERGSLKILDPKLSF